MKFEISAIKTNGEEEVLQIDASSIVGALESSHKQLQLKAGLSPTQYKIIAASKVYPANPSNPGNGEVIKMRYDIPGGPNPVFEKKSV